MKKEQKLNITINLEEAKLIFKALGKMPFEEVYELIGHLNEQVNEQERSSSNTNDEINFN